MQRSTNAFTSTPAAKAPPHLRNPPRAVQNESPNATVHVFVGTALGKFQRDSVHQRKTDLSICQLGARSKIKERTTIDEPKFPCCMTRVNHEGNSRNPAKFVERVQKDSD